MNWVLAYGYIFCCALALSLILTPLARRIAPFLGMMDEPGERKIHAAPMPLLGGAAVFAAFAVAILLNGLIVNLLAGRYEWAAQLAQGFGRRKWELMGVFGGGVMMLVLGMRDDKHDLSAKVKLIGQFVVAIITVAAGMRLKLFITNEWLAGAVTVAWIVTVTNAINIFDNMDGLCSGIGVLAAVCFAVVAGVREQFLVCGLALAFAGALLGFLVFNFPPAKIFLGDSGSHLVGYMLAVLAILPTFYAPDDVAVGSLVIPLLAIGLPLFDAVAVVLIRLRNGKPIYKGDMNHLSHRLERMGLSRRQVSLTLYGVQLILGLGAALLLWVPPWAAVIMVVLCGVVLLLVSLLPFWVRAKDE